jgi:hypothetical protein
MNAPSGANIFTRVNIVARALFLSGIVSVAEDGVFIISAVFSKNNPFLV